MPRGVRATRMPAGQVSGDRQVTVPRVRQ